MGIFMRSIGGIPVYRNKQMKTTDAIASQAKQLPHFRICITPEGTRSANPDWKKGFYYIALKADIPVLLCALDFEHKRIVCHRTLKPTGDIEKEMAEIKAYYSQFKGKHPHKFAI
ncbi:MAG: 1-acyl-sn-glycerol-3-phosphate acyltransferase, partial [Bacteroidaceae bacterium]|nr:1-acyl-sn-glycerol-3-phosphate acyltransferase [Bacteroidaceae bacterium]